MTVDLVGVDLVAPNCHLCVVCVLSCYVSVSVYIIIPILIRGVCYDLQYAKRVHLVWRNALYIVTCHVGISSSNIGYT